MAFIIYKSHPSFFVCCFAEFGNEAEFSDERNFIFNVLLQIAIGRDPRHTPDRQSARLELALESLAIQISQAGQALIHKTIVVKMFLFLQSYVKLLVARHARHARNFLSVEHSVALAA